MAKFTYDGKDAECIVQHWDYPVITHRTLGQYITANQQAELKRGKMSKSN